MGDLPAAWERRVWGDLAVLEYGRALRGYREHQPTGVRVYGTNGPIGYTDEALGPGPTVVVGRKGAYRGIHFSPGPFYVIDTAFFVVPTVPVDLRWAYYELLTHDINGMDSGSAIPSTSRDSFYAMPVLVPPLEEQRAIADVLGALDDKLESNRRIAVTSTHLARALLGSVTARMVRLGTVAKVEKGLSYNGSGLADDGTGFPMVNLGNFTTDGWLNREGFKYYAGDCKPKHIVRARELVVANTDLTQQRSILGQPGLVPADISSAIFSHHVFAIRLEDERIRFGLWAALSSPRFRERAEGYATGTTVAALPPDALEDFVFSVPEDALVDEASALLDRAWLAERESRSSSSLRDALLPELLAGRMRVRDAGEMAEA